MAQPLTGGAWAASTEVLAVARRGSAFTPDEQGRFGHLARQTAVALENVALHDQLRRQATGDELAVVLAETGLDPRGHDRREPAPRPPSSCCSTPRSR
jgi:GAF domain-containing protein